MRDVCRKLEESDLGRDVYIDHDEVKFWVGESEETASDESGSDSEGPEADEKQEEHEECESDGETIVKHSWFC